MSPDQPAEIAKVLGDAWYGSVVSVMRRHESGDPDLRHATPPPEEELTNN